MLTGMVNIAVFAAFWPRVGGILRSTAAFKPVCRDRQLDVSCYGWQKRQETAMIWQRGRQKRHGLALVRPHPRQRTRRCQRVRMAAFGTVCGCQGARAWGWLAVDRTYLP